MNENLIITITIATLPLLVLFLGYISTISAKNNYGFISDLRSEKMQAIINGTRIFLYIGTILSFFAMTINTIETSNDKIIVEFFRSSLAYLFAFISFLIVRAKRFRLISLDFCKFYISPLFIMASTFFIVLCFKNMALR